MDASFEQLVAPHRRELHAHCYRMCGSVHEADDLLQESLVRAWKGLPGFEGRASLRTWLYKVATSVCLDALARKKPRLLPMNVEPASPPTVVPTPPEDPSFLEPYADAGALMTSPESRYAAKESVALAFLVALQELPPKQRAVLLLCEVLGFGAAECAEMLGMTVAAVNSALQRARQTLDEREPDEADDAPSDEATMTALRRYVDAWVSADVSLLVSLLREDATLAMPPLSTWFSGAEAVGQAMAALVFTPNAKGTFQLVPIEPNGAPGFAIYQRDESGVYRAIAIHALSLRGGRIAGIMAFLDPRLFPRFGLPIER